MKNKEILKSNLIYEFESNNNSGGQQCGIKVRTLKVKSEELGIELKIKHFRSDHKNKEFASLLMDLVIDELIK